MFDVYGRKYYPRLSARFIASYARKSTPAPKSRRRGGNLPVPQRIAKPSWERGASAPPRRLIGIAKRCFDFQNAKLSWERGASAPLIIVFFLIVVFYAPSLLIGVCAIGCLGLTTLRILKSKKGDLALLSRGYVWREPHSANHPLFAHLRWAKRPHRLCRWGASV